MVDELTQERHTCFELQKQPKIQAEITCIEERRSEESGVPMNSNNNASGRSKREKEKKRTLCYDLGERATSHVFRFDNFDRLSAVR